LALRKGSVAAALLAGIALAAAEPAGAGTCAYDPGTRTLRLELTSDQTAFLYILPDGSIGTGTDTCGEATVRNTNRIVALGTPLGSEELTLSQHNRSFVRGLKRGEIKIKVDLKSWDQDGFTRDMLRLVGTDSADAITLGTAGFDLNSDGDLDVAVKNDPETTVELAGGNDTFTARGGAGVGAEYGSALPLTVWGATEYQPVGDFGESNSLIGRDGRDLLAGAGWGPNTIRGRGGDDGVFGAPGNDILSGGPGLDSVYGDSGYDTLSGGLDKDFLHGGGGNDLLVGGEGDDTLEGEPGRDDLQGGSGDDYFYADDGEADSIDGGEGAYDRAFVDESTDTWLNVESVIFMP
jgi:Ca2+-binding RTX toxin-like protein